MFDLCKKYVPGQGMENSKAYGAYYGGMKIWIEGDAKEILTTIRPRQRVAKGVLTTVSSGIGIGGYTANLLDDIRVWNNFLKEDKITQCRKWPGKLYGG